MECLALLPISLVAAAIFVARLTRVSPARVHASIWAGAVIGAIPPIVLTMLAIRATASAGELRDGAGMATLLYLPMVCALAVAAGVAAGLGAKVGKYIVMSLSDPPRDPSPHPPPRTEPVEVEGRELLQSLLAPKPVASLPQPPKQDVAPPQPRFSDRDRHIVVAMVWLIVADLTLIAGALVSIFGLGAVAGRVEFAVVIAAAYSASFWASGVVIRLSDPGVALRAAPSLMRRWALLRKVAWTNVGLWVAAAVWGLVAL